MKESMGQIIRRLRKERGLTQDELAEILGVTFQAVSKWENDSGMPDISQVVPLATVFNVSTDVLFGIYGTDNDAEAMKIIEESYSLMTYPVTTEIVKKAYDLLHDGLKKYPSNFALVMQCLEKGIALAYPSNDIYDAENGEEIYKKCIPEADYIIKYSKNATDILRARMIMVLLHSAYGNFEQAKINANEFPWRSDMTIHKMRGYIARWEKKFDEESKHWQTDFMYHFEAMLDDIVDIAISAYHREKYDDTIECLNQALSIISLICKDEDVLPRFHVREAGDIHYLLAIAYLKRNDKEKAYEELRNMVECDMVETEKFIVGTKLNTPLLHDVDFNFYWKNANFKKYLLKKLNNTAFAEIRNDKEFHEIMKTIS